MTPLTPEDQYDKITGGDVGFIIQHAVDNNLPAILSNLNKYGIYANNPLDAVNGIYEVWKTKGAQAFVDVMNVEYLDEQNNGTGGLNTLTSNTANQKGKIKAFIQNYAPQILNALGTAASFIPIVGGGIANALGNASDHVAANQAQAAAAAAAQLAQDKANAGNTQQQTQQDQQGGGGNNSNTREGGDPPPPEDKTMMWVGIGAAILVIVVVIVIVVTKKK